MMGSAFHAKVQAIGTARERYSEEHGKYASKAEGLPLTLDLTTKGSPHDEPTAVIVRHLNMIAAKDRKAEHGI